MKLLPLGFAGSVGVVLVGIAGAVVAAPPASSVPDAVAATQTQVQQADAKIAAARARQAALQAQVSQMEQQNAARQTQLQQRDAEIAALQQKLQAAGAPAPAASAGH